MSSRADYFRAYNKKRPNRPRGMRNSRKGERPECLGLDGEGFDSGSVYAYMACSSRMAEVSTCEELRGLTTVDVLEWLLSLPQKPLKFGFSLGYDYTKWLADLPDESLYLLCRPEERAPKDNADGPPDPIVYAPTDAKGKPIGVYVLNMLGSRLSVQKYVGHGKNCDGHFCAGCLLGPKTVIWDVFKFFQSSFVKACLDWGVITAEEFETLKVMKGKRPDFARPKATVLEDGRVRRAEEQPEWLEIKRYCQLECRKMAELAERLLDAHIEAGLKLKQYFGAGSTGAAMLDKMAARSFIRQKHSPKVGKVQWRRIEYDPALQLAVACGFFGGRFEISQYGPVETECWSYDISSAYPYAFTFLPCLVHGKWRRVCGTATNGGSAASDVHHEIAKARTAIVRYRLPYSQSLGYRKSADETAPGCWGPFPFRMPSGLEPVCPAGSIIFPATSGGGWVGRDEYLAGHAFAPNVEAVEAWIYETSCDCKVLKNLMPENYKLRLGWGKEGKGVVAKLGQNSCYGKCAQTKGKNPPYQEFVWALLTTGSCRAQLLRAMATDRESVVLLATDGIISTRRLDLETPRDTGTFDAIDIKSGKKKPLGGWEEKPLKHGVFLIRPGIAFPLNPDEKESEFKARGIGKHVLRNLREVVLSDWYAHGPRDHHTEKQLFFGMKSQVYRTPGGAYRRTDRYGRFGMQTQVISYNPSPKRPAAETSGKFLSWALDDSRTSIPYGPILGKPRIATPIVAQLEAEKLVNADQDDLRETEMREF